LEKAGWKDYEMITKIDGPGKFKIKKANSPQRAQRSLREETQKNHLRKWYFEIK
jgi:hypothetical protein